MRLERERFTYKSYAKEMSTCYINHDNFHRNQSFRFQNIRIIINVSINDLCIYAIHSFITFLFPCNRDSIVD